MKVRDNGWMLANALIRGGGEMGIKKGWAGRGRESFAALIALLQVFLNNNRVGN